MEGIWGGGYESWSSSQCGGRGWRRAGRGLGERVRGRDAVGGARKVGLGFLGATVFFDIEEGRGRRVLLFLGGPCPGGGVTTREGMGQACRPCSRPSGSDSRGG